MNVTDYGWRKAILPLGARGILRTHETHLLVALKKFLPLYLPE
jgi:hypothetical protein